MTVKINPWLLTAIIIGICILIFSLIRGCNQSNLRLQADAHLKKSNDSLIKDAADKKRIIDSAKKIYQDTIEFVNGQYALVKNQKERIENELYNSRDTIKKLIAKHRTNSYTDTTNTPVPNDFIADCHDCFNRLENGLFLVDRYKQQVKASDSISIVKSKIYEKRIKQQELEKQALQGSLNYAIGENEKAIKKLAPKGQLYFSWGVLFNPIIPKMAGVGLMYQDRHRVIWAAKGWFGQYGNMWEANMNLPLSLKRK